MSTNPSIEIFTLEADTLALDADVADDFLRRIQAEIEIHDREMRINRSAALSLCMIKERVARRFDRHRRNQAV